MPTALKTPKTKIVGRALVRDSAGNPKFSDKKMVRHFKHRLSPQDIAFLKTKFGPDIPGLGD